MYLNPQAHQPHSYAAFTLWRMGAQSQALTEFRISAKLFPQETSRYCKFIDKNKGTLAHLENLATASEAVLAEVANFL